MTKHEQNERTEQQEELKEAVLKDDLQPKK